MQLTKNVWFIPVLAMLITFVFSTARIYVYINGVIARYVESFRVEDQNNYVYWTFHSKELQRLILDLKEKDRDLKSKEEMLGSWAAQLRNEKSQLDVERQELESFQDKLMALITDTQDSEFKNLKGLASTYATMDPAAAVQVLNEMDDRSVVKILALMKADSVSAIFEAMISTPGMEAAMRARIARISEKLRLYNQN